ncbi:MAG TPA: hypothetical protein VEH10_05105, partial [Thermoplasmata archaeon]|nr:hypothetical protein [Thermoplasmata archaeon]
PKPRAVETAEAMGYGVARELPDLGGLPDELDRWVVRASPRSFADYAAWVDEVAEARTHAEALAGLLRGELEALADGACLLVVSHGGVVELAAVGAVGTTAAAWGPTLGYLEGVELGLGPSGWVHGRVVRGAR